MTETANVKHYALHWQPYAKDLGYLLFAEIACFWLVATLSQRGRGLAGFLHATASLWWLWLGLTACAGLLLILGSQVQLTGPRLTLLTLGRAWRPLALDELQEARVLCVGDTLAVLGRTEAGEFRLWRRKGLKDAPALAKDLRLVLGPKHQPELVAPFRSRRGSDWRIGPDCIRRETDGAVLELPWTEVAGVKFLFTPDEELPVKLFLFHADGGPVLTIGEGTAYFPFAAAEILKQARSRSLRVVCADLGQRGRKDQEKGAPLYRRAWEEQGWQ